MGSTALLVALLTAPPAGTDPDALIRRAIAAHGGADRLDKLRRVRELTAGELHLRGKVIPFTSETLQRLPGSFRHLVAAEIDGRPFEMLQVYDGQQGWLLEGGTRHIVDAKTLVGMKATAHAAYVASLTPLLAPDKGYRFRLLPEERILERPALGIEVDQEGQRDVSLYFDRASGLLVKKVLRPHAGGASSVQEEIFSDFKDVEGLKRPTRVRILLNGVMHAECVLRSTEFLDRVDDAEFSKP